MKALFFILILFFALSCSSESDNTANDFSFQWGTKNRDIGKFVIADKDNNIYVAGETSGDLDKEARVQCKVEDCRQEIFLSKFDKNHKKLWTKLFGTTKDDYISDFKIDKYNDIYVAGNTNGAFPQYTNAGKSDNFLIKVNTDGIEEWTKQWGTENNEHIASIDFDSGAGCNVLGYIITKVSTENPNNVLETEMFNTKFTVSGIQGVNYKTTVEKKNYPQLIKINNEKIYTIALVSDETNKKYLFVKINNANSGMEEWTKQIPLNENENENIKSIDMDNENNIYALGEYNSNTSDEAYNQNFDLFLIKFNDNLEEEWKKTWGSDINEFSSKLLIYNENIYAMGYIDNIGCEENLETEYCSTNIILTKFDINGNKEWVRELPESDKNDIPSSLIIDNNNTYITGDTMGTFPDNKKSGSENDADIFLLKTSIK